MGRPVLAQGSRWRLAEIPYPTENDVPGLLLQVAGPSGDWTTILPVVPRLDYTSATRPSPSAAYRWPRAIRVRDPGGSETLQTCLINADGSYGWTIVAMAPA